MNERRSAEALPGRREPVGPAVPPRQRAILWGVLAVAVVGILSLAVGTRAISPGTVWDALVAPVATDDDHTIVRTLRVPRTVLGLGAGMALGLAGAVMQGLTRNPLADPGILGISAGSALAVVIGITQFGATTPADFVWFAFGGAAVASVAVYALASLAREGSTPVALVLAGAAMSTLLGSVTAGLLITDEQTLDIFRFWAVGSIRDRGSDVAAVVSPFLFVGSAATLLLGRSLNTLALGDDLARTLGQRVQLRRAVGALSVVVLCGAATAAAGPIVFVGLVVPQVARAISGPDYRGILAWSAVLGPVLLLGADIAGRVILPPSEVEVGVMTAAIGGPFFVLLVRRSRAVGL